MKPCPVCGGPQTPGPRGRVWCAVYGDHRQPQPGPLMLAADAEMQALDRSVVTRFKRRGVSS